MKIMLSSLSILVSFVITAHAAFTPYRISFDVLHDSQEQQNLVVVEEESSFMNALTTTGIISITSLPQDAKQAARTMVATQQACLEESSNTQKKEYHDGTIRITLATHTVAGAGGMQALKHKADSSDACQLFEEAATIYRLATQNAVAAFAAKVTSLLNGQIDEPLLVTESTDEDGPEFPFTTFADVVENGDHLEHFHSYLKTTALDNSEETIGVHTDQGLFIAFTPGRLSSGELTKGFYIQTATGDIEQVEFTDSDDLIFMLGDGVNQFINNKLMDGSTKLRAVPHAVRLDSSEQARVWYGLMVLPPSSALHPMYGVTLGEIRQGLITGDTNAINLACSPIDSISSSHRFLDDESTSCTNAEEIYCWHRCMNATSYNVSEAICTAQSRTLKCINPRGQLYGGIKHGDYFPGCAGADWITETNFTTLPDYPRNDLACANFADFYNDGRYNTTIVLTDGNGGLFQYNLTNVKGQVKGRLAFNGIFGFLAFGFRGFGGRIAMLNAHILLAMRAGGYTPMYGMNLSDAPEIHEYIIDLNMTSFRFWNTPIVNGNRTATGRLDTDGLPYQVHTDSNGCFTSLTFELTDIAGKSFNIEGKDELIWAANSVDSFMQYHGKNRGKFNVTWNNPVSTVVAVVNNTNSTKPAVTTNGTTATTTNNSSTNSSTTKRTTSGSFSMTGGQWQIMILVESFLVVLITLLY